MYRLTKSKPYNPSVEVRKNQPLTPDIAEKRFRLGLHCFFVPETNQFEVGKPAFVQM